MLSTHVTYIWRKMRLTVHLAVALLMFCQPSTTENPCPVACVCEDKNDTGFLTVDCHLNDLRYIPPLPNNTISFIVKSGNLTSVEDNVFENARCLTSIKLDASSLEYVNKHAFDNLRELNSLHVSSYTSVQIDVGAFSSLVNLSSVYIRGNLTKVPTEYLCGNNKLRSLTISNNKITSIRLPQCVDEWKMLQTIDISYNPLKSINKTDFFFLQKVNLTSLIMSHCNLTNLSSDVFQYVPHLKVLRLEYNNLQALDYSIFLNTKELTLLSVAGTLLQSIPLQQNEAIISQIIVLDLRYCTFMKISFGIKFRNATQLATLRLDGTSINALNSSTFVHLTNSNITELTFGKSNIIKISDDAFKPLIHLKMLTMVKIPINEELLKNITIGLGVANTLRVLQLRYTDLSYLDHLVFSGFSDNSRLTSISVTNSNLNRIGYGTFTNFHTVDFLDLSKNKLRLESFERGAFAGLNSLRRLCLTGNKIDDIPNPNITGKLTSLQQLEMENNSIKQISTDSLAGYPELIILYLGRNMITGLHNGAFDSLKNLQVLRLDQNEISEINEAAFRKLTQLHVLNLSDNKISTLGDSIFLSLHSIRTIELHENRLLGRHTNYSRIFHGLGELDTLLLYICDIEELPANMFINNANLTVLGLGRNLISTWDPNVFKPLIMLQILSLSNNHITSVNEISFQSLVSLRQLDLSGNPLACTCDLLWLKHRLNTMELYLLDYNKNSYICYSPDKMKGVPLQDFSISPDDCSSKTVLHILMYLAATITAIGACVTVVYRYRWYLRYYMFLLASRRRKMRDALVDEDNFQYDAYVCYHHTSRNWIINSMLPELEYKGGLKLCIHDRDWLAGPYIVDNIVESLDCSRKTLLLINNEFAKSAWCREEMSLAYHRFVEEQRNFLVVVLMENIETGNMNKTLRTVLSTQTYLDWQQGVKKEVKFWKALRRSLRKTEHPTHGLELGHP